MHQKLILNLDKRGYLHLDFIFAAVLFFLVFIFVFLYTNSFTESQRDIIIQNELNADARDLCFMLVSSSGMPSNWYNNISTMKFLGLRNFSDNNSLSTNALSALNSSNYFSIVDRLNLSGYPYVNVIGIESGTTYTVFGSNKGVGSYVSYNTCYSYYNNEFIKIIVGVWK